MTVRLMLLAAPALLISTFDTAPAQAKGAPAEASVTAAGTADEQAIRGKVELWHELIRAKDSAAIARLYTEDGAVMPPNAPMGKGRSAIETTWAGLMQIPGFDLHILPEQITVSSAGDMALDRGTYRLAVAPNGNEIIDIGKYVVVWRKVGGQWKAAADIFNSDLPAG